MNRRQKLTYAGIGLAKVSVILIMATAINAMILYKTLPADKTQWRSLTEKLETYHAQTTVITTNVETFTQQLQAFDAALQQQQAAIDTALQQQQAAIDTALSLQTQIIANTAQLETQNQQITTLHRQLSRYDDKFQQLKPVPPPAVIPKTGVIKKPTPTRVSNQQPKASISAPFSLLSLQWRGAVRVAVVAPLHATSLTQVALVNKGDSFQGWQITAITDSGIALQQAKRSTYIKVTS